MPFADPFDAAAFFEKAPGAQALYEAFQEKVCAAFPQVQIKVQKTQITFSDRYGFAFVSLPRSRKIGPPGSIVITFGLSRQVFSPRIFAAVEPYPNRWTHHIVVQRAGEIDGELMGWISQVHDFALQKIGQTAKIIERFPSLLCYNKSTERRKNDEGTSDGRPADAGLY